MPRPAVRSDFEYNLPQSAIAQVPVEPRHAARLLDTRRMEDKRFSDLPAMLDPGDLVVVNSTRVRRARLAGRKETGGACELLLLERLTPHRWVCLIRPARRIRPGVQIEIGEEQAVVESAPDGGRVIVRFATDGDELARRYGEVPLPPYIRDEIGDEGRYQTVYAERVGSAAAPTAGLHFTPTVLEHLQQRNIDVVSVDLEVGLDTFRPISVEHLDDHVMHAEWVEIPASTAEAVHDARRRGARVVAIGTTVVRTLESGWSAGRLRQGRWSTDLFIRPGYDFHVIDAVVTNFHVPGSTLVVMIAALLGDDWRRVYGEALERGYRFLSFGDAMYLEAPR